MPSNASARRLSNHFPRRPPPVLRKDGTRRFPIPSNHFLHRLRPSWRKERLVIFMWRPLPVRRTARIRRFIHFRLPSRPVRRKEHPRHTL